MHGELPHFRIQDDNKLTLKTDCEESQKIWVDVSRISEETWQQ